MSNRSLFSTTERQELIAQTGAVAPEIYEVCNIFSVCGKECVFTSSTNTSNFVALKFILHLWSSPHSPQGPKKNPKQTVTHANPSDLELCTLICFFLIFFFPVLASVSSTNTQIIMLPYWCLHFCLNPELYL